MSTQNDSKSSIKRLVLDRTTLKNLRVCTRLQTGRVEPVSVIVSVVSNRVIKVDTRSGKAETLFEDCDPAELAEVEAEHMAGGGDAHKRHQVGARRTTGNLASLAFGGPDLLTLYCGSLDGTRLFCFAAPVAGAPPPHWQY